MPNSGSTVTTLILFLAGGALLVAGAELLVRGASRLAITAGIAPLVVGLTVVAFGTSAPELAVTVGATFSGQADLALGNIVGSNIANILLILGVSAAITPLIVSEQIVRLDVPLVIGASVVVWLLALDGWVSRLDGLVLFTGVALYTVFLIRQSRREVRSTQPEPALGSKRGPLAWLLDAALIVVGLGLLVLGARWLVQAAVTVATAFGVSLLVIGLTVAVGTSLPEVATSVMASLRGERDIAVGNVIGSCLFNLLAVLGLGSLLSPVGVPVAQGALTFDIPVMTAAAVATLPIFFHGYRIERWEGAVSYYVAYTSYLVLDATDHHALNELGAALMWFALPLTALTLLILVVRALQSSADGVRPDR